MRKQIENTFVLSDPSEILEALVGLKDVRVLHYERRGPEVALVIEQVVEDARCPTCHRPAQVKDRPRVTYVDLPVFGAPMRLTWKKHRLRCVHEDCRPPAGSLRDHRIAAKNCLLTTRAAKWATRPSGTGRTVLEVAKELNCDWHTVNDAVTTYGEALLEADRKRLNRTSAIGLDETSFVKLGGHHTAYATTVTDVEHHQIIDILPTRNYVDVAGFFNHQSEAWKSRITYGALDMSNLRRGLLGDLAQGCPGGRSLSRDLARQSHVSTQCDAESRTNRPDHRGRRDDPLYRARRALFTGEEKLDERPRASGLVARAR